LDRLNEGLNAKTHPEIEEFRAPTGDGVEIARNLDRLEIVEPELMARHHAEPIVGRLVWASLDPAEASSARRICTSVEMQLIKPLLGKKERAFGPIDLEVV
jgi:hypothetical protein